MERHHLTAWREHAPWPRSSQIEHDLRLSRGVVAIFGDAVLREHVAMRGGTLLHKGHLAPAARYAEDIVLVLIKPMASELLEQHLIRVLEPVLGQPAPSLLSDAWLTLRNLTKSAKLLSVKFKFIPLGRSHLEMIKIDVHLNEHKSLFPLVEVAFNSLNPDGELIAANAVSYDINEMLGTKTRSLMQREQGRDLFDLWYAWDVSSRGLSQHKVDGARAMQAFEWYLQNDGTQLGREEAEQLLAQRLHLRSFRKDTDSLLRPGLPQYDIEQAAATVRSEFLRHLTHA